ncbi:MAG TPA: LON peptidase substrate-binding domain-containing protein, partial [Kofleriaceae bacterium]|nr:LON peptidase substrate-binding domain-containing protein [Kofleriaceae bacterium]
MPKTLPIVPIRTAVLFPGVSLPITAARPATLRAIEAALRDPEHLVLVVAQRDDVDEVLPEGLFTIGTIAKLGSVERGLGGVRVALEGQERGIVMRVAPKDGYLLATVSEATELQPLDAKDPTFVALHR